MNITIKIILTLLLWIGLPLVLFAYIHITSTASSPGKSAVLFVMYSSFSWSIALLAFVMESTRQQLFQRPKPARSALRLAIYGCFAVALALLTSPWLNEVLLTEILTVISWVFVYCYSMGFIYTCLGLSR